MTIVPRLQNSSYRHQPKEKKKRKTKNVKTYSVVYTVSKLRQYTPCFRKKNIHSYYRLPAEEQLSDLNNSLTPKFLTIRHRMTAQSFTSPNQSRHKK